MLTNESGLGSIITANKSYRSIYGKSPEEELNLTKLIEKENTENSRNKSQKVYSIDEAIELLRDLKETSKDQANLDPLITLIVKLGQ